MTGYVHGSYAASLSEHGAPRLLPRSGAWILERSIPGSSERDAMGCYPLLACRDWSELPADLDELAGDVVAFSAVTDPFGAYDLSGLALAFPDRLAPFKEHFVADLEQAPERYVSRHHRRYARTALREVDVECVPDPLVLLDEWVTLYSVLIERHGIRGIPAFSRAAFAAQLGVPGLVAFRATQAGRPAGIVLCYVQDDVAYYHLGAYSPAGYEARASFALFWCATEFFRAAGLRWLNLGAGAGLVQGEQDGLARFKQGWSTGTRTTYFGGRVFDRGRYADLLRDSGSRDADYFPAYRAGEFGRRAVAA